MGKRRWNLETMNEYCIEKAVGYKVIDIKYVDQDYQKNQLWALVKCSNDKHDSYWIFWNLFTRNNRCMQCYRDSYCMTTWNGDSVYNFCKEQGYIMLDKADYVNIDKGFYCYDKDGFIKQLSMSNLKRVVNKSPHNNGFSIIKNNKYAKYNIDLYCRLYRPEYEFISSEYKGVKELHTFKYNGDFLRDESYGREFECTIDGFLHGNTGHPFLTKSLGEITVENYLANNNIKSISQFKFNDCIDKQVLPFDFIILSNTNDIICAIEFQGKQHYEAIEFFGGEKQFKYIQKHDKIKEKYCKNNNIPLIIIPYWKLYDKTMECFLYIQLVKHGAIEELHKAS